MKAKEFKPSMLELFSNPRTFNSKPAYDSAILIGGFLYQCRYDGKFGPVVLNCLATKPMLLRSSIVELSLSQSCCIRGS